MSRVVPEQNVVILTYDSQAEAEAAIRQLGGAGFDMKKVSVVARDEQHEDRVQGYFLHDGRLRYWGNGGAFWSGLWQMLSGGAFFVIPDLGPVLVAGPLGGLIVTALENSAIFAGLSAVGGGLYSIGVPWDSILAYEAGLRAGRLLVVAQGAAREVQQARAILKPGAVPSGSRGLARDAV